jgi:hypothetical protein
LNVPLQVLADAGQIRLDDSGSLRQGFADTGKLARTLAMRVLAGRARGALWIF